MFFDQSQFAVRCEWGMNGLNHLADADVIIIVDVLSFTTCVEVAMSQGAEVFPFRWKDERAATFAEEQGAALAVKRDKFAKDAYSLAPSSLQHVPEGLKLVLPSPNGSNLVYEAKEKGVPVIAGCLRNAQAVATQAKQLGSTITVIPAGERWPDASLRPAIEDLIGAGAIIHALGSELSPEARIAEVAFFEAQADIYATLAACSSGRELIERDFEEDVRIAAELNVSQVVPLLDGLSFK